MDVCIYYLKVVAYYGCAHAYHFFDITAVVPTGIKT